MPKAVWNGATLAESADTVMVDGNHYFPPNTLNRDHFVESEKTTVCSWKGTATYYDVVVDGTTNKDAAWYYADPKEKAENLRGRIAFWHDVEVTD
ncbi:MAG: DUF427 domain-containing protein [Proteobacteria bacterium]|nr:DUF427 domain-containing protein [Pseudomonadota bacterium]